MGTNLKTLKWLAVDFDGTLAESMPDYSIGPPITENIAKLLKCSEKGYKIIIHTARHWEEYKPIEEWLDQYNVPYKAIVCGKVLAHRYIDDRNIDINKEWVDQL